MNLKSIIAIAGFGLFLSFGSAAFAEKITPPHPVQTIYFDCRGSAEVCEQQAYDDEEDDQLWCWQIIWSDGNSTWGGWEFD